MIHHIRGIIINTPTRALLKSNRSTIRFGGTKPTGGSLIISRSLRNGFEGVVYFENVLSKTRGNLILCASARDNFIEINTRTSPSLAGDRQQADLRLSREYGVETNEGGTFLACNTSTLIPWILLFAFARETNRQVGPRPSA